MMPSKCARFFLFLIAFTSAAMFGLSSAANAQPIPREEYIRFVPLEVPRVIRQTPASERLHLYGQQGGP